MMNHQAIYNAHPSVVSIDDTLGAMDSNGNPVAIDQAAYEAEVARLEAEHAATQYQRDRAAEYPSIEALVVALWEGVVEERMSAVTALEAIRQEIKARYPKP
jgi:hypothetical protein